MKKYLLSLLSIFSVSLVFSQSLPNGGFESWAILNYENPKFYQTSNFEKTEAITQVNALKTTDSYHGQYAIKLTTSAVATGTKNAFGWIANFQPDPSMSAGGIPYNQKPTGIRFHYKSNIMSGDTAIFLCMFKKGGVQLGLYLFKIANTQTAYTLFNATFSPALSATPDTIGIACASSMAFNNGPYLVGNSLQVDSIMFKGVTSQPVNFNGDLETWLPFQNDRLNGWNNMHGSYSQSTDAYSGSYAIELQTANSLFGGVEAGEAATGQNIPGGMSGGFPYTTQIDTLVFYYKYLPADPNDNAECNVLLKKNGVQIGGASKSMTISPSYQKVMMPFNVGSPPDSINFSFRSSKYPYLASYVGSDLKMDNMYLASQKIPISSFVSPPVGCTGKPIQLIDNSSNGANAWGWIMPGGIPGSSTAQNPVVVYTSPGTKTITMISSNSFGSGNVITKTINIFVVPSVASTSTVTACGGGTAVLMASGAITYTWSTGSNSPNITVTPTITTNYTVTGASNGCQASAVGAVVVPLVPKPDICMVTVDSANVYNQIFWDKTAYPNLDSMIIFREVISNTYKRIGAVSKNALSMWIDTARSVGPANGDPNISTYRYKIQVRDTCGQYGPKSLWHNTVYFTHTNSTFFWTNNYMIEGPMNPVQTYSLMVCTNPTVSPTYSLVGTTTGNQSTLNDPFYAFYQATADWRVEADLGYVCTPTQRDGNGNNIAVKAVKTKSNIQNNRLGAIGINEIQFKNRFRVYPNPSNGIINIESMIMDEETNLVVRNVLGQEIYSDKMNKGTTAKTIDLSRFAKGVYSMELSNANNKAVYKLITE